MSDFNKPFLDLPTLLPQQNRDKALVASLKNIFNNQLTKSEFTTIYGYAGEKISGSLLPYIDQPNLDRQLNELQPIVHATHGTEEKLFTFNDILNKLALLGVDLGNFSEWGKSQSFNFVPPINIDKFCNYNKYYWIGELCESIPKYDLTTDEQLISLIPIDQQITPEYRKIINNLRKSVFKNGWDQTIIDSEYFILDDDSNISSIIDSIITNENIYVSAHNITVLSNILTIHHNLGFNPKVLSILDTDRMVYVNPIKIEYPDNDTVVISFNKPLRGIVRLFTAQLDQYVAIEYEYNKNTLPEYYQIARGGISDWSINNFWVHENDLDSLGFSKSLAKQAIRPIIEYHASLENSLNKFSTDGIPSFYNPTLGFDRLYYDAGGYDTYSGLPYIQNKSKINQLPLFDLYYNDGTHSGRVSPIFYFSESTTSPLDHETNLRILIDPLGDYMFEYGTYDRTTQEDLFFKIDGDLTSIWVPGDIVKPRYVKPDTSGSLINLNKITNYSSYYWFGHLINDKPTHNPNGQPEYTVIERGGNSGWSTGNNWVHIDFVDSLPYHKNLLLRATQPIIEFSMSMESELNIYSIKTTFGQLPKFNIYDSVGHYLMPSTLLELYTERFPNAQSTDYGWVYKTDLYNYKTDLVNETFNLTRYFKLSGLLKNYASFAEMLQPVIQKNIDGNPLLGDGTWLIPEQMYHNIANENRSVLKQGDLHSHFITIIGAQYGLEGSSFGSNNFRQLPSIDSGLGGNIKIFNGDLNLFVALMNQENSTPLSLIEFLKMHYDSFVNSISDYTLQNLPSIISENEFSLGDLDFLLYANFLNYHSNESQVSISSATTLDDNINRLFYDSSSEINNCVITLPYLGLCDAVEPQHKFDNALGFDVIVHHDGHVSRAHTFDIEYIKKVVNKNFLRSNNQILPGIITANLYPSKPFKGQMWFNTTNGKLCFFNVLSDSFNIEPTSKNENDYWYDRNTNALKKCVKTTTDSGFLLYWTDSSDFVDVWQELKVEDIINRLILNIENTLYHGCSIFKNKKIDIVSKRNENVENFDKVLEIEFQKFGAKHNIDIYSTNYDPSNAFTWNYKQVRLPFASKNFATWQEAYKDIYGTERPNIEPWVVVNTDKTVFLATLASLGIAPFSQEMWAMVKQQINKPLSVNTANNDLLPPYMNSSVSTSSEALITTVPSGIDLQYTFGDLGYIEATWRKSIEFNYSMVSTYFKIDPINFTRLTWGYQSTSVNQYEINSQFGRKLSQHDFYLHGEKNKDLTQNGTISNIIYQTPVVSDKEYTIEIISDFNKIYSVTEKTHGFTGYGSIGDAFVNDVIRFNVNENRLGLKIGDKFIVALSSVDDSATVSFVPAQYRKINGMNQAYVQYSRSTSHDLQISADYSILTNWDVKLGYRFSGMINTDNFNVKSDAFDVNKNNYNVYIKENKHYRYLQMTALRIQLVKKGSSERKNNNDIPQSIGEDWVYRVESYNRKNPFISVYEFDQSGQFQTFNALSKRKTPAVWKQFLAPTGTKTYSAPFLITGIQNVVNFIFGYARKLENDGWVFNNDEDPNIDADTGRAAGWQLEIEKFIDYQYQGIDAGFGSVINPFINRLWINTPRGVIADFTKSNDTYDSVISQNVGDINQTNIDFANIKIFRSNEQTEIDSSIPMFSINALHSEYEHVILFDNYTSNNEMVYDQFLGINVKRLLFKGEKQVSFNGRVTYGGRYLLNHQLRQNIEASVSEILNYYDTDMMIDGAKTTSHARGLIGYTPQTYLTTLGMQEKSIFGFWKAMLHNKGSNFSIDAFINSSRYKTANVDEYWAYKLAEFGDARPKAFPEIKLESYMSRTQFTKFQFIDNSIDVDQEITGFIPVYQDDDNMWFTLDDIGTFQYFEATVIANVELLIDPKVQLYNLEVNGKTIYADYVEIYVENSSGYDMAPYDTVPLDEPNDHMIPTEMSGFDVVAIDDTLLNFDSSYNLLKGDRYMTITGYDMATVDDQYLNFDDTYTLWSTDLGYALINACTLKVFDESLYGKKIIVRCYGPDTHKYNPAKVIDYRNNVVTYDNMILWDPARGLHSPDAIEIVDMIDNTDPARYNTSTKTINNVNYDINNPWEEREVGTVWWNTKNLDYIPYFDAKIFTDVNERISRWGAISDASSVDVAEWTEVTVPPNQYLNEIDKQSKDPKIASKLVYTGEPAFNQLYSRDRAWRYRPIAWKYSSNPILKPRDFKTSGSTDVQTLSMPPMMNDQISSHDYVATQKTRDFKTTGLTDIMLMSVAPGPSVAVLTKGNFLSYDLNSSSAFSFCETGSDELPLRPIGQANIIDNEFYIIGTRDDPFTAGHVAYDPMYFASVNVFVTEDPMSRIKDNLGQLIFSNETVEITTTTPDSTTTSTSTTSTYYGMTSVSCPFHGTGFKIGDVLSFDGLIGTIVPATIQVTTIDTISSSEYYAINAIHGATFGVGSGMPGTPAPGSGYQVGDVLTLTGIPGTVEPSIIQVTVLGGFNGEIGGMDQLNPGKYLNLISPSTLIGVTGGHGTGATFVVTSMHQVAGSVTGSNGSILGVTLLTPGKYLVSTPPNQLLSATGGSGSGASFTALYDSHQETINSGGGSGGSGGSGEGGSTSTFEKYIVVTGLNTGITQKIKIAQPAATDGSLISYVFDDIGIIVSGKTTGLWSTLSNDDRITTIANEFGNSDNDVSVYAASNIDILVPFVLPSGEVMKKLPGITSYPYGYWIGWDIPTSTQLANDNTYPYNNWEPWYGDYINIGSYLPDVVPSIISELKDEPIHNGATINMYDYAWGNWILLSDYVRSVKYDESETFAEDNFKFDPSLIFTNDQVFVYKNEMFVSADKYSLYRDGSGTVMAFPKISLRLGDKLKVVIRCIKPSVAALAFDPSVKPSADNPLQLTQYKYDYQYTYKNVYDKEGLLIKTLYYYWVKNKIGNQGRNMSLKAASMLLKNNTNSFAILEGIKPRYDAHPPRYTQFIIYDLNQIAKKDSTYKLRFTKNCILRDDSDQMNLKNIHTEWQLIKASQRTKIPSQLWTLLTNAVCQSNLIGEMLPSNRRTKYDALHGTRTRFGFLPDQIFVDSNLAITSIKNTIRNTKLTIINQSAGGVEIVDTISFAGFDINALDDYFSTSDKARMFMHQLWENAKGIQVNEIFFEVLYDALSENYEFTDIIKTSLLSAHSIKLISAGN